MEKRLQKLIDAGHQNKIDNFFSSIEKKTELPQPLQEKLDKIGDTPLKEKDLYEKILESPKPSELALMIFETEEEILNTSPKDIVAFTREVVKKVSDLRDSEGKLKTTPNVSNCNMPNIIECDKIATLKEKLQEAFKTQFEANQKEDKKTLKKNKETIKALGEELDALVWQISGLNKDKLSEWEKRLVGEIVKEYLEDVYAGDVGKQ